MASRKPDFKLKVLNKVSDATAEVGAAWNNDDGSISLTLNECVVLTRNGEQVLTLFPSDVIAKKRRPLEDKSSNIAISSP